MCTSETGLHVFVFWKCVFFIEWEQKYMRIDLWNTRELNIIWRANMWITHPASEIKCGQIFHFIHCIYHHLKLSHLFEYFKNLSLSHSAKTPWSLLYLWCLLYNRYLITTFFLNLCVCWVFLAVCGLSLVVVIGGCTSLWCVDFSLQLLLLLRNTGSRCVGFSNWGPGAQ